MFNKYVSDIVQLRKDDGLKAKSALYFYLNDLLEAKIKDYPNKEVLNRQNNSLVELAIFDSIIDFDLFLNNVAEIASGSKTGKKVNLEIVMDQELEKIYSEYENLIELLSNPDYTISYNVVSFHDDHQTVEEVLNNYKTFDEAYKEILKNEQLGIEREIYQESRERTETKILTSKDL